MKLLISLFRKNVELITWGTILVIAGFGIGWGINSSKQEASHVQCVPDVENIDVYKLINSQDQEVGCVFIDKNAEATVEVKK